MRFYKTFIMASVLACTATTASAQILSASSYLKAQSHRSPLVSNVSLDPAVAAKQAENKINALGDQAISALESEADDAERARVFDRILNENFDMDTIARFSLGRYWAVATDAEKKRYTKLFKDMIVDVYSKRFEDYSGQKFDVKGSKPVGRKDIIVNSSIVSQNGQPPVRVDWRLRNEKIIDVVVEGVSMSVTQRSEFNSIIQRNGGKVSALIEHLEK
jgi:phospholipid transport system substrate-binding protein